MVEFDPDFLAAGTGGRWTKAPAAPVTGFDMDTRTIGAGQAFVALKTGKRDGHDFLDEAREAGASAAIVSKARPGADIGQLVVADPLAAFQAIARAHRRRFKGPVVGITGSAGKTSTKDLLALLLGSSSFASPGGASADGESPVLATRQNFNNHIGVPLTLTRLDSGEHRFAVIEAGISAPGEMASLAAMIEPDIAIVTLVAPAHLEELGGIEGVAREKAALAAALKPDGLAIFPSSCAEFGAFANLSAAKLVVERSGASPLPAAPGKMAFSVEHGGERTTVALGGAADRLFSMPRVSDGMAQNAALALSAALALGVSPENLRARIGAWRPAALRGEWRRSDGRTLYLDCYNANPASMADALAAFCAAAPETQPRLFVLGSMEELGAESGGYHRALGRSIRLRPDDALIAIGAHAASVRDGAIEAGNRPGQIAAADSAEAASARVAGWAGSVFIKGSRKYALERLAGEAVHA